MAFQPPREVLLIEIERYCSFPDCRARNRISLTKAEAIEYGGFDCFKCERWNDDTITRDAVPESWADSIPARDNHEMTS
jgi:hypothetical protein